MISEVTLWSNGMLMVFDAHGQQMPEYQGPFTTELAKVFNDAPADTKFYIGDWQNGRVLTSRTALSNILRMTAKEGRD